MWSGVGRDCLKMSMRDFWGDGHILYLNWGGCSMGILFFFKTQNCILKSLFFTLLTLYFHSFYEVKSKCEMV